VSLPRKPFGSVCHLVNGKAFKPTDWSNAGVPIIRIQNLNGADKPFNHWAGALDKQVLVKTGDLLLAWSGTPGTSFGAHIWSGPNGILNQHIFRCDLDQKAVTKEWARIAVNHRLHRLIEQAHGGVGLQHVTRGMVEELEIPLPPLAEQRRIAEVLDRAEALRAKRRAALAQLDSHTQSLFLDSFVANNKFPSEPLDSICELITDGTHYTPTYSDTGVIFLSSRNVTSGYITWDDVKYIPESLHAELHRRVAPKMNDILLAKNGTTGIAAIVDRDCVFDIYVSLALLRPSDRVLPIFLQQAVNSPACTRQFNASLKGIGVPNLHLKEIRKTKIPVPPISLQREFARRVTAVEALKTAQRASLAELDAIFATLQHRAFRGDLGVSHGVPPSGGRAHERKGA
jgi:type I restriction enzyme, S subunit